MKYEIFDTVADKSLGEYGSREACFDVIRPLGQERAKGLKLRFRSLHQKVGETEWKEEIHDTTMSNEELLKWVWPELRKKPDLNIKRDDFTCTCSPDGTAQCEAVVEAVKQDLSRPGYEVNDSNLLSQVVYALNSLGYRLDNKRFYISAAIDGIYSDQWSVVTASGVIRKNTKDGGLDKEVKRFSTYIQCDHVEHGVAATWLALKQQFSKFTLKDFNALKSDPE